MKLDILYVFLIGCFVQISATEGNDKGVVVKAVPEKAEKSPTKHTIEKKSPAKFVKKHSKGQQINNIEKEEVVIHNHGDKNYYDPFYKKSNLKDKANKQKSGPKKKYGYENDYKDEDFEKYFGNWKDSSKESDKSKDDESDRSDNGYKTSKTVHTEHFEVKEINPQANSPDEKYIIRGGYKVQETDPFDSKKKTHLHTYDSPLSKIAASIYSKYDYLNFPHTSHNEEDDFLESEEKDEEAEHSNIEEYYGKDFSSLENDDEYYTPKKLYGYSEYPKREKQKADNKKYKYDDTNYYSSPSHESADISDDMDSFFSKDWKKYILQQVYGDVYSPSNRYGQKAPAKRKV